MIIKNNHYVLELSDETGSILSLSNAHGAQLIAPPSRNRPLFMVRFRYKDGEYRDIGALDAGQFHLIDTQDDQARQLELVYSSFSTFSIQITVTVRCPTDEAFTYWSLAVEHDLDGAIEWIDFPDIVVPNNLISKGGSSRIFWPAMEGCLVENAATRDETWFKYAPVGYPSKGWEGYYPGPCPMQFMAYYSDQGGLYLAAHDPNSHVKAIEYYTHDDGVRLEYKLFPGGVGRGVYRMDYPMVIGVYEGDWMDAAEIYRLWTEKSILNANWTKTHQNRTLPTWFEDSPIVVIYPVRGDKDTGGMDPNEYFPYVNAVPYLNQLSEQFNSQVMALLMHWEGTAPWAPPYVWPPFGGEQSLRAFVNELHASGNLVGVYCSGIGWTNESILVPEYNRKSMYEDQHLEQFMCAAPDQSVPNALICNGNIRWGHDICPSTEFAGQAVLSEIRSILSSGCDYIQYFDQNLGGASSFCYSDKHNHPPAPGLWQKDAMISLFEKINDTVNELQSNAVIGCESAAAEPYIPYLKFNDLRFNVHFAYAKPVPAYAYVYHEYISNFMGNQNGTSAAINPQDNPDNLLFRIAYSFTAGDMLSIVLKDHGLIHWDWCTSWEVTEPNQPSAITLIHNLNGWRKKAAKNFLCFGKMVKPNPVLNTYDFIIRLRQGDEFRYPSLLTSKWISPEGTTGQIIVNYTHETQSANIPVNVDTIKLYTHSTEASNLLNAHDGLVHVQINPLSAVLLEFDL